MDRNIKIVKTSILGVVVNILLVIFKSIVGLLSNSIAIILDAVNNLSDVLSSVITIVGVKLSNKKPDKKHPYGYGRVEYFSSVIIAIIVMIAGLTSLKESFIKIINPVETNYTLITLIIVIISIFTKVFLGLHVKKVGEDYNSNSLVASGVDALSDSVISLSTLVAAVISILFNISLEGYLGAIISFLIIKTALDILKETVTDIIGERADVELTKKIREKLLSYKGVIGVFDLTFHNYGPNKIISTAHIQVNDDTTAKEIHRLTRRMLIDVYNEYGIIITIGIYASNDKGKYRKIYNYIRDIVKEDKNIIQMHGFYVDEEEKKISFDLIFSFDELSSEKKVEMIRKKLTEEFPKYDFSIIIDTDFTDVS